jgi:hypothetical protein
LSVAIWSAYFLNSVRVRSTFVESGPRAATVALSEGAEAGNLMRGAEP